MAPSSFGGIHPPARKEYTRGKPLMLLDTPPERVSIPLNMSAGNSALPIVRPGDRVRLGQPIARADGEESAEVHASVSGRVEDIRARPYPWGGSAEAIVISNDGEDALWGEHPSGVDLREISQEEIMARIRAAGITDMGRDASPAHWKILWARGRADTLVINAAESDPYVTADYRLLLEFGPTVLLGARALTRALGVRRTVIAAEGDKLNAVEALELRIRRFHYRIELCTLPSRYPLGGEKQIVQAVTGREIPPGGAALDAKCVVFNVAAAFAVGDAILMGRPLTHRAVTVAGGAVTRPRNLWVPIGTPLKDLVVSAGGFQEEPELMLLGGPMSGAQLEELEAPVIKNTNSLLCLAHWERPTPKTPTTCIRCGQCVSVCPMHLAPVIVHRALGLKDYDRLVRLHPEDCMECGCCTYICPSYIPLVENMCAARDIVTKGVEA